MKLFRNKDLTRLLLIASMAGALVACGGDGDTFPALTGGSSATSSAPTSGSGPTSSTPTSGSDATPANSASAGVSLSPAAMQAAQTELVNTYAARLSGAQAVPDTTSTATGGGAIVVNPDTGLFTATLTTTGITGTAATIQSGSPDVNGDVVFNLTETAPGSGIWTTATTLNETQLDAFTTATGNLYFNVSSAAFPDGEIRGQILPSEQAASGTNGTAGAAGATDAGANATSSSGASASNTNNLASIFIAALRGAHETPAVSSPGEGSTAIVVDPLTRQMIAASTTIGITSNAAHIHIAPAGQPGPIVFPLTETNPGSGVWTTTTTLTEEQFNTLLSGDYYVNMHTVANPDGEIRGQIFPVQFGTGATAGNGTATGGTFTVGSGSGTSATATDTTGTGMTDTDTTGAGATGTDTTGTGTTDTTGTGATGPDTAPPY